METNHSDQEYVANANNPAPSRFTVTQVLDAFLNSLAKPNNYIRIVRGYLHFCLDKNYPINSISAALYTNGQSRSGAAPIRTFVRFAYANSINQIQPDPPAPQRIITIPSGIPNSSYISDFIQCATTGNTKHPYARGLQKFFKYVDCQGFSYTRTMVDHFVMYTCSSGKSESTANLYSAAIRQFTQWILENRQKLDIPILDQQVEELQAILRTSHALLKPLRQRTIRSLSKGQVTGLLDICSNEKDRAVLALLAITGLRTREVAALTWSDVRIEKVSIIIRSKKDGIAYPVKLFGEALKALTVYMNVMQEVTILNTTPVFEGLNTSNKIQRRVDKYLLRTGLKRKGEPTPSLRLTAGLLLLEWGCKFFIMQCQLRYSNTELSNFFSPNEIEQHYFNYSLQETERSSEAEEH